MLKNAYFFVVRELRSMKLAMDHFGCVAHFVGRELDNIRCRFAPHVVAASVGQEMRRLIMATMLGVLLVLPATHLAAEGSSGVGIVRGTITISGKPTADAIVLVKDVSSEQAKAQLSGSKLKKAVMDQHEMKFVPRVFAVVVGTGPMEASFQNAGLPSRRRSSCYLDVKGGLR